MLVQWHLQKQAKTFVSRLGDRVASLAVSGAYYGVILGDNSLRVIRNDNNKVVVSHKNAHFDPASMGCELGSVSNILTIPYGDTLQFVDFSSEHIKVDSLSLRPRNVVSNADGVISTSKSMTKAYALSPNEHNLCTLD